MYSISPSVCTELLEILNHLPDQEKKLVPDNLWEYLETNKDDTHDFEFMAQIPFDKQNISTETKALIVSIFKEHFSTSRLNDEINQILYRNSLISENAE